MSALIKAIRADANYKQFLHILKQTQERLDLEVDQKEAMVLHSGRLSRGMYGKNRYSAKTLIDASLVDMSSRSRLVEIRVKASIQLSVLDEAVKAVRKYLMTEYADDLSEFKTAEQRRSFCDRAIKHGLAFQEEGAALLQLLDRIIEDIDKASFHLRNIMECLKLLESRGKPL